MANHDRSAIETKVDDTAGGQTKTGISCINLNKPKGRKKAAGDIMHPCIEMSHKWE
jgi:hypothetical protein